MYLNDFFTVPMSLAASWRSRSRRAPPPPRARPTGAPGLPVGFQIAAPAFGGEQALLEAAHALEGALDFAGTVGDAAPWKGGARHG